MPIQQRRKSVAEAVWCAAVSEGQARKRMATHRLDSSVYCAVEAAVDECFAGAVRRAVAGTADSGWPWSTPYQFGTKATR